MKEVDYWERFMMTGSVSDFLSYKNALQDMEEDRKKDKHKGTLEVRSGDKSHAGLYGAYRDDIKG